MKNKIRPIYSELQGMLSQAPNEKTNNLGSSDDELWNRFNALVNKLEEETKDDSFKDFIINPKLSDWGNGRTSPYVTVVTYRGKISGLISRLHGTYFVDEPAPFSGQPGVVVSQTQNVSVEILIQLGADLQKALDKTETPEEKTFIEAVKDKVGTVKSYIDFLLLVTSMAQQYGVTLDKIKHLFGQ